MTTLTVPPSLDEIVRSYDIKEEPFTVHDISRDLIAARNVLVDPSEAEKFGSWAEALAFALATGRHENPWNCYFGPHGSATDADDNVYYSPDIAGTPAITVDHWAQRARSLTHPFLKARYSDLAWEMGRIIGNRRRDVEDARIAIDCYLDAIPRMSEDHEHVEFAVRALDLADLIKDQARAEKARTALMNVYRGLMLTGTGSWWRAVDRLLENTKTGIDDPMRDQLMADLENVVANGCITGDPAHFNPHEAKDAAERLILIYNRSGQYDDVKRLHKAVGEAFEHFASQAEPMLASALLQTATDEYRDAGLKDDRDRTRILMQQKIGESGRNLKSIEHRFEIKKEDMEAFLDQVVVDDVGTSLVRIARAFMLKRAKLEGQVQDIAKSSPLVAHIPQTIMGDEHVAAKIGSVEEDAFGRVVHQANIAFQIDRLWLIQALRRLFEKHDVVPEMLAGFANRHEAFDDMSLLVEGIRAWTRTDHVKAVHVLIPQIERALRNIGDELDVPITKPHPRIPGASVVIGMGEILNNPKVAEALGPDTTLHFQALYADPRGMNLRNEIAHGMMNSDRFYFHLGNLVVHSLLILGLWKEFGAKRLS
jgi:Domain of unknown function (DUF4209)